MTLLDRFLSKTIIGHECWLWSASKGRNGYGSIRIDGKTARAHIVSYKLFNGTVPDGMCVLHRCDTPACVRPDHLFLGTQLDNIRDRCAKGRTARTCGERAGLVRLKTPDVISIRTSEATLVELAQRYRVSPSTISKVRRGQTWAHLPTETRVCGYAKGERAGHAKLTMDQVREIRASQRSVSDLTVQYSISRSQIYRIRSGLRWAQIA